jgi:hypothetical protein
MKKTTTTKAVAKSKTSKPATKKYQDGGEKSRLEKRLDKKKQKTVAKSERDVVKAVTKAKVESTLKEAKDDRAKRAQGTISAIRSKEKNKNINVQGDRRLVGNNTTTNTSTKNVKIENRADSKTTKSVPKKSEPLRPAPRRENDAVPTKSVDRKPIRSVGNEKDAVPTKSVDRKPIRSVGNEKDMREALEELRGGRKPKKLFKNGGVKKSPTKKK